MLPQYADGSKGKGKGKKPRKNLSTCQKFILLVLFVWFAGTSWHFYHILERKNGAHAGGLIGLILLGPNSVHGRSWRGKCTAFLRSMEDRFPIPGWTDDLVDGIGQYRHGEFLEQMHANELTVAEDLRRKVESYVSDRQHSNEPVENGRSDMRPAAILPEGSYQESCTECTVSGLAPHLKLHCSFCKDGNGESRDSVLNLADCRDDEWVGNRDGHLACEPLPHQAAATAHEYSDTLDHAAHAGTAADGSEGGEGGGMPIGDADLKLKDHMKLRASEQAQGAEGDMTHEVESDSKQVGAVTGRKVWPARPANRGWDASKVALVVCVLDTDDTVALKATLESLEKVERGRDMGIVIT